MCKRLWTVSACLVFVACSPGGTSQPLISDVALDTALEIVEPVEDVSFDTGLDLGTDLAIPGDVEVDGIDLASEDTGPEPGTFGWPCQGNEDCDSGYCVHDGTGYVCTINCIEECPVGWKCIQDKAAAPDLVYVCVPFGVTQCAPCTTAEDCKLEAGLGMGEKCLNFGESGSFCAMPCPDGKCPGANQCVSGGLVPADGVPLCVPPEGEECGCSGFAVQAQASTGCSVSNEFGTCVGERACTVEGLTECSAAPCCSKA